MSDVDKLDADDVMLQQRVAELLNGELLAMRCVEGGRSRQLWTLDLKRDGRAHPLIMLRETGFSPGYKTRFKMTREAQMLDAIAPTGIPVPKVYYVSPADDVLIMERLAGRADFKFNSNADRVATIEDFNACLAKLHALDPMKLDLQIKVAATQHENSLNDLADYEDSYRRLCCQHEIVDRALDWLKTHVPVTNDPPRMLHGDAGALNFMHANNRVTGLIDWEMSHVGDPHDDLAWIWFRIAILKYDSDAAPWFDAYRRQANFRIEPVRLTYYILFVIFRCTIATLVRQAHDPEHSDARPAQLREILAKALSDAQGNRPRRLPPVPLF